MQFRALAAAFLAVVAVSPVVALNGPINPPIYPRVCGRVCGPVVTQSQGICAHHGLSCICTQKDMSTLIPLCEACASNARDSHNGEPFYSTMKKLINDCKLKTTSITLGAAAPTAMPLVGAGAAAAFAAYAAM